MAGDARGDEEYDFEPSELRNARRCITTFPGVVKGDGLVTALLASEVRSARGLKNKSPKSALGRRSGALGRLIEGITRSVWIR